MELKGGAKRVELKSWDSFVKTNRKIRPRVRNGSGQKADEKIRGGVTPPGGTGTKVAELRPAASEEAANRRAACRWDKNAAAGPVGKGGTR